MPMAVLLVDLWWAKMDQDRFIRMVNVSDMTKLNHICFQTKKLLVKPPSTSSYG